MEIIIKISYFCLAEDKLKRKSVFLTITILCAALIVCCIVFAVFLSPPKTVSTDDFELTIALSGRTEVSATLKNKTSKLLKITRGPTLIDYFVAKDDEEFDFEINKVFIRVEERLSFTEKDSFNLPPLEKGKYKIIAQASFYCNSSGTDIRVHSNVLSLEI